MENTPNKDRFDHQKPPESVGIYRPAAGVRRDLPTEPVRLPREELPPLDPSLFANDEDNS